MPTYKVIIICDDDYCSSDHDEIIEADNDEDAKQIFEQMKKDAKEQMESEKFNYSWACVLKPVSLEKTERIA